LRLNGISGAIEDFFEGSTILIIDIPPKLRGINKENFVSKIEILIPFIEKSTIENILFISSTSVYGDDNDQVTEETVLNPDSEGGKQLAIVEGLLQGNSRLKLQLRFGVLIGEDRNPIRF
jgi:nucleoside-diphosphate-sugar epimerase